MFRFLFAAPLGLRIVAALLGGFIASQKGRSALGWGMLCFLGPFLMIVVAILPRRAVPVIPSPCSRCGRPMPVGSHSCPHCGQSRPIEMVECSHCHTIVPAGPTCGHCGGSLP